MTVRFGPYSIRAQEVGIFGDIIRTFPLELILSMAVMLKLNRVTFREVVSIRSGRRKTGSHTLSLSLGTTVRESARISKVCKLLVDVLRASFGEFSGIKRSHVFRKWIIITRETGMDTVQEVIGRETSHSVFAHTESKDGLREILVPARRVGIREGSERMTKHGVHAFYHATPGWEHP